MKQIVLGFQSAGVSSRPSMYRTPALKGDTGRLRLCLSRTPFSRVTSWRCPRAAQADDLSPSPTQKSRDPFVDASFRLENLLSHVGDGEEDLFNSKLCEEPADVKLRLSVGIGAVVTILAILISSLCGTDPFGGASFSLDSLQAAAVGSLLAAPLVVLRHWAWSSSAHNQFPALQDMHRMQVEKMTPWMIGLQPVHVAIMLFLDVLPMTMLLYPASQSGLTLALTMYSTVIEGHGPGLSSQFISVAALVFTSTLAGIGQSLETNVSEEELEVVQTAVSNADRYYRLMAVDLRSSVADAQRAALAFKAVAAAWLASRQAAANTAGIVSLLDVFCLGGIWYLTHDLTAPAVGALLVNSVDCYNCYQQVSTKERRVARH